MPRLGGGRAATVLGAAVAVLAGLLAVPSLAAAAEGPSCGSVGPTPLVLREDKPYAVGLDCVGAVPAEDLLVTVQDPPRHGTAGDTSWRPDVQHHAVPYDPDPGYVGPDSFTVEVSDGTGTGSYTVSLEIEPNSAPSCDGPDVHYGDTPVGGSYTWTIPCWDLDWQDAALDYSLAADPAHGTVVLEHVASPGDLSATYTADAGYSGTDSFTARVSDGDLATQVQFHVYVSDPPWCFGDEPREVRAGQSVRIQQVCNVPTDGSAWELRVVDPPEQGTVAVDGLRLDYTADASGSGADTFGYQVVVGSEEGNLVTQQIEILPDTPPACEEKATTVDQGASVEVALSCTDAEGDPVTLAVHGTPDHGTLGDLTEDHVTYTPDPGYAGPDSFTYTGSDYARTSTPSPVTVAVTATTPPGCTVAGPDPVTTRQAQSLAIDLECSWSGADLRDLHVTVADEPAHGSTGTPYWDADAGRHAVAYEPAPAHTGADTFTVQVTDGVTTSTTPVEVEVVPNHAPVCAAISTTAPRAGEVVVPLACTDDDGDELTLAIEGTPDHGTLGTITDGQVTYTPDKEFTGPDSFSYTATDYLDQSVPSTVTITTSDEDPPQLSLAAPGSHRPRRVARHGLRLRLGTDEHVVGRVRLTVTRRLARRLGLRRHEGGPVRIGSADVEVAAGGRRVRVHLTRRARHAIRRERRLALRAVWAATDDAGNRSRVAARVRLRR